MNSHFGGSSKRDASKDVSNLDALVPLAESAAGIDLALDRESSVDGVALGSQDSLVATQPQTQSQPNPYKPDFDEDLVGCLIPSTNKCQQFNLFKNKQDSTWSVGRYTANDLVLPGEKLSNFHCTLKWNRKKGSDSEVVLIDTSTNGTWVDNVWVRKDQQAILRSGCYISFGAQPDGPNDWRFIFRDVEGQSKRHMNQIWAKYDIAKELGAGTFARVHKCIKRATGEEYAMKIIDRSKLRRHSSEEVAVREISILKHLADFRHDNVVSLREHFEEEDAIYIIMELVRGGDLLTYINSRDTIAEEEVQRMAAQICHAVAYIHSHGITHRDLKPENVLLTATNPPNYMVADFGLAKLVDGETFLKTMCGTAAYIAPEIILQTDPLQGYDNRVDSWSLGVIFYRMLTNHAPFDQPFNPQATPSERKRYFITRRVNWQRLNACNLSSASRDFLRHLLVEDPGNRKEAVHMLDHRWISALLPLDSQFQHPPLPSFTLSSPTIANPSRPCSHSFENLHLSDISIPGLKTPRTHVAAVADTFIGPDAAPPCAGSFASEMSVEAKIPAVPRKPQKEKGRQPFPAIEQGSASNGSAVPSFLSKPCDVNQPVPSRRTPPPVKVPEKRKWNSIEDCSSLSSLCSLSDEEEVAREPAEKPPVQRAAPRPPKDKGRAVRTLTYKRARRS